MSIGGYTFVFDVEDEAKDKIFFDPTERRRGWIANLFRTGFVLLLTWAVLFFSGTMSLTGLVEELGLRRDIAPPQVAAPTRAETGGAEGHAEGQHLHATPASQPDLATDCAPRPAPMLAAMASATQPRRLYGHLPAARDNAELSLGASCAALNVVMPDWIMLELGDDRIRTVVEDEDAREDVNRYLAHDKPDAYLLPVVTLEFPGEFDPHLAAFRAPETSEATLNGLVAAARELNADGLCLDFDQLSDAQLDALTPFFLRLKSTFRDAGLASCTVLSAAGETWKAHKITRIFDRVVLKLFQPGWVGSVPGPLAANAWFEATAREARERIGADRLVVALGTHAVDWTLGQPLPATLSYAEATQRAAEAGAEVRFSATAGNAMVAYRDVNGQSHRTWMLDAVSAHNQLRTLDALGLRDVALWSLGAEDPGLWPLLRADLGDRAAVVAALSEIRLVNAVHYTGEGPFLRVRTGLETGLRFVDFADASGRITGADYARLPQPYTLERYGQPTAKQLVLTFDDGPDPHYTGQILDTLKETSTPAAFFVVGARAMQDPALLKRMIDEGHEIGSHTFSHPRMDRISRTRGELELSMMHKLIAGYSGRDTLLYREPFLRAGGPVEAARAASLATAQAQGAIIAGMDIVPKDWEGLTATEIVDYVLAEVGKGAGNVLLFHDGGGDRTATVEALPILIARLKAQGYSFTSLAGLLGTTRDALMPPTDASWPVAFDKASFEVISGGWASLKAIFWVVLAMGLARALFFFTLALKHRKIDPIHNHHRPKAAFVIPAHNEEGSVRRAIERVLKSTYDNFEVIVVDDGSTDDTFEQIQMTSHDPRVKVFAQLNRGKWGALNTAIRNTDAEVLVCIDADTHVMPDALGHLVKHFFNPRVGAVAGKVVVGNRVNLLTRLQALEYITSQNFERRAQDLLNSMIVVPGAIGAWRREALIEAGLYSGDTVTEDADITISVNRAGYRISYEDQALAYTEAPETVRLLLSQRLRWSLGMFQCAWKHRGALFERGAVGRISLPDLVIFGYLYALLAPLADLFLVIFTWNFFFGQPVDVTGSAGLMGLGPVVFAYLALPAFELFVAGYALKADKSESLWMLLLFPFQRFFYRQLLYFSVLRALFRALTGVFTGWGRKRRMQRQLVKMEAA